MILFALIILISEISASGEPLVYPVVEARLSSGYGKRVHPIRKSVRHHGGIDLAAPNGSHVRSVAGGRVIFAGELGGYGKLVSVDHENGYVTTYGHLSVISVEVGERIETAQTVGRVGSTGLATGPHLHFEVRKEGKSVDPSRYLPSLTEPAKG